MKKKVIPLTRREKILADKIAKLKAFENELRQTMVQTFECKISLFDLIKVIGVKHKVVYYNILQMKGTVDTPSPLLYEKVFDYGFIFKDGFEIRNVNRQVYNYAVPEVLLITKRRERI